MAIQPVWDNAEKTIIRVTYEGRWTWDDVYLSFAEKHRLLDTVDYPVDILADFRQNETIPPSALSHARTLMREPHPNEGITAVVGANRVLQTMYDMFRRVFPGLIRDNKLFLVPTVEEAYALIAEKRRQRESSTP